MVDSGQEGAARGRDGQDVDYVLQILFVLGLIATGIVARRRKLLTGAGTSELARVLIGIIYPALILTTLPALSFEDLAAHVRLPLIVMGIALSGLALGLAAMRVVRPMADATTRSFLFNCLINNYLFLPLPLVMLRYGERGAALLFFSSIGFELILWTLGVCLMSPGGTTAERVRKMFGLPMICILISLGWIVARDLFGVQWPEGGGVLLHMAQRVADLAHTGLETIGRATVAVSMLVAGSRVAVLHPSRMRDSRVWLVSAIRLVGVPILVLLLLSVFPMDTMSRGVLMIVAVMPSSVTSVVFGERFGGDTEFIAGALLMTHLWALLTVPVFLAMAL